MTASTLVLVQTALPFVSVILQLWQLLASSSLGGRSSRKTKSVKWSFHLGITANFRVDVQREKQKERITT
jgi:hypothetical protein